ncbi:rna helicase [Stylonychia lemnae]|uniref:Rna helicase n=1 Tax=Stylonychia lemnae TaxID=5949 RepID=A0A078ACA3_STYLE|nr:rna helicase [Stylonychia lemnae]|eukprot:CDW79227.1 rna helicase [Stylonychia lemnae]
MTIDSDSDVGPDVSTNSTSKIQKQQHDKKQKKNSKKQKQVIPGVDEEDIQLNREFQLQDEGDFYKGMKNNQTAGSTQRGVGDSKSIWNFQDTIKTDQQKQKYNQELAEEKEKQNFKNLEEKIVKILDDYGLTISDNEQDQPKQNQGPKPQIQKTDAKVHYDKEDLISFHQLFISKPLVKACQDLEYDHPTVIQRKVIPAIIEGNDILAHAVTGSGKTASYLLPIMEKYLRLRASNKASLGKLRYLILQPTRELAAQSYSMCQNLSKYLPQDSFNTSVVFGGSSLGHQKRELENQPDMVIGTIGRILDHIHNTKGFTLENVDILVLDEADKLLEMGFKDELLEILKNCSNPKRQTLMVSATLNQDIKELAQLALKQALQFTVSQQQKLADNNSLRLTQYIVRLPENLEKIPKQKLERKANEDEEMDEEESEEKENLSGSEDELEGDDELDEDLDGDEDSEKDDDENKVVGKDDDEDLESEDSDPYGDEGLDSADDSDDSDDQKKKHNKKEKKQDFRKKKDQKPVHKLDPYLIRREATLLNLVKKHFKQRVIIFFNEKAQCHRMMILFRIYGLDATEVHGNLTQQERMQNIELFQSGQVEYLLATDLVARGLDLPQVKTVINFSFPTEPKRYLHRIGRTARAGAHGVAITICNDEERKEIKKLTRKLGQQVSTYTLQTQQVKRIFTKISAQLDQIVKEISVEEKADREMEEALMQAKRAENMIKYKDEIMNRPKKHWQKSNDQKKDNKEKSKKELDSIKNKFEQYQTQQSKEVRKRDQKMKSKEKKKLQPGQSKFEEDVEHDQAEKKPSQNKGGQQRDGDRSKTPFKKDQKPFKKRPNAQPINPKMNAKFDEKHAKLRKGRRDSKVMVKGKQSAGTQEKQKTRGEKWKERSEQKMKSKEGTGKGPSKGGKSFGGKKGFEGKKKGFEGKKSFGDKKFNKNNNGNKRQKR